MVDADTEAVVGYFGFGSLVNKDTLRTSYIDLIPARLKGVRRYWQETSNAPEHVVGIRDDVVLLSIKDDPDTTIDGAIVIDSASNLPAVDKRESGYTRFRVEKNQLECPQEFELPEDIYVYRANTEGRTANGSGVLLQSYLDAVMQGYCNFFGEDGVANFVNSTDGFDRPIILDRKAPLYPRSVQLQGAEAEFFDAHLKKAGVHFP